MTTLQFTADIPKEEFDNLENHIKSKLEIYCITKYIIGQESQPKEHYHFIIHYEVNEDLANKFQTNLVKTIVDKYNLRTPGKGGKRKYMDGNKQRIIKDFDNCVSYITKENNYRYIGYEKEYIEFRQSQSFIKDKDNKLDYLKLLKDKLLLKFEETVSPTRLCNDSNSIQYATSKGSYLHHQDKDHFIISTNIKKFVFQQLLLEDRPIKSQIQIKNIALYIVQYSDNNAIKPLRYEIFMSI